MKGGAGKKSSPLDDIRPTVWPESYTDQLLDLIWTLESTIETHATLNQVFESVIAAETLDADQLPMPTAAERKPPQPS